MTKQQHQKKKCRKKSKPGRRSNTPFAYKRIVVKISGEAMGGVDKQGDSKLGIDYKATKHIAKDLKRVHDGGVEVAVVVGGGNQIRGEEAAKEGMDRAQADYMGMLGTVINGLALQDALEQLGCDVRVMSAVDVPSAVEPYIRRRAIRHLEKRRIVIFVGGIGNPFFSTDSTVVQRAVELNADLAIAAKNGVDGVYTGDPKTDPTAYKLDRVSLKKALRKGYKVMDPTAFAQALAQKLTILVIDGNERGELIRALRKAKGVGTIVYP